MQAKSLLTLLSLAVVIIFGFQLLTPPSRALSVTATVDIKPETLNVNMNGKWITAFIALPEGYNASDIDTSTILLEGLFGAKLSNIEGKRLMVKFDASSVTDYLWGKLYHMGIDRASIDLLITGKLKDGTQFAGSDTITIINP